MDSAGWLAKGEVARLAHEAVTAAFKAGMRETDRARYDALLDRFRMVTTAALPSSDADFMAALAAGKERHVHSAIAFLEADPWFFRSGYEKQNLIRHLKRIALSDVQRLRLAEVVLKAIDGRDRQEFRHYCRLACAVWSDALDASVAERLDSRDAGIRRRATWIAKAAMSAGKA